jgi:hypothetical protein
LPKLGPAGLVGHYTFRLRLGGARIRMGEKQLLLAISGRKKPLYESANG